MEGTIIETEGSMRRLKGAAHVETSEMRLRADYIEYDEDTGIAKANGHVKFEHFTRGEVIEADRGEYNDVDETGRFYDVKGTSPAKIQSRPGVLTSTNPFVFQGEWADKLEDKYILHKGFVTSCKLPRPWWVLRGKTFDVIPGERAIARNSWFRLRNFPLFYTPYFYKSLEKFPRRSGFLTPNLGNSSRRGKLVGFGYYWAINRSYDLTYRGQWFTQRGFAHTVDFRGKPNERSDFNVHLYGVNDTGLKIGDNIQKYPGYMLTVNGRYDLGHGWQARGNFNYLSSLGFQQEFTESYFEAISSEVHSIGYVTRQWNTTGLDIVASRVVNYQSREPDDKISIRKLPSVEYSGRERELFKNWPVYFSFDSSAAAVRRNQPLFQSRSFVDRLDVEPRVTTAFSWAGFHLTPSFSVRETHWGSSLESAGVTGQNVLRSSREAIVDVALPSLARIFEHPPKWMGQKLKHVIEPRAVYRNVGGVKDFNRLIRFDETELLSNTNEIELSITNRLYAKGKDGNVREFLSWQVAQKRFFDPTFGGAVVAGRRNVLLSTAEFEDYAFLDRPRNYSPVISVMRLSPDPRIGIEWRSDYDPLRKSFVNNSLSVDGRFDNFFISAGHTQVRYAPLALDANDTQPTNVLAPSQNQFRGMIGLGQENKRGWNESFLSIYDFRTGVLQWASAQVTYNTDCCGFSVQYRRVAFGTRNENQFRVAFNVANIGSVGTLRRQDRLGF